MSSPNFDDAFNADEKDFEANPAFEDEEDYGEDSFEESDSEEDDSDSESDSESEEKDEITANVGEIFGGADYESDPDFAEAFQGINIGATTVTVDPDFDQIEEGMEMPEIKVVLANVKLTGNLDQDLKQHLGETLIEFNTRSKITRALVVAPYGLQVKSAILAGKLWCQKAIYNAKYSPKIEAGLLQIQQRAKNN